MSKNLVAVEPQVIAEKIAKLIAFLEDNNYGYVSDDSNFIVGIKDYEIVEEPSIIMPKKPEIIT